MKISIPINLKTINSDTLPVYYEQIRRARSERVFICILEPIFTPGALDGVTERLSSAIRYFKDREVEVGIWVSAFGHGRPLYSDMGVGELGSYDPIVGLDGGSTPFGLCPLGEKFREDYLSAIKRLSELSPDLIMLDDDFRFNRGKDYFVGCFCQKHTEEYYRRVGERIDKSELKRLIFSGAGNKYRSAFMDMLGDTLVDFAKDIRASVDSVNPKIRLGVCSVRESIDYDGVDPLTVARAFAGETQPFTRASGAPYGADIIGPIEFTRMQFSESLGQGVEIFSEGDTYPRPRYNCPSSRLELYNYALVADGLGDGRLDYIIDYNHSPDYETGYLDRYIEDAPVREALSDIFRGKSAVGVRILDRRHKLREWELPSDTDETLVRKLSMAAENPSVRFLSFNSIPTVYSGSDYPVMIMGENAREIDRAVLKNGAILDSLAARILMEQGIDTGLKSAVRVAPSEEYFIHADECEVGVDTGRNMGMTAAEGAIALSVYKPSGLVASYSYTNALGERFMVLGCEGYFASANPSFENSYLRQKSLVDFIEDGGVRLPAVSLKSPGLYILAAKGQGETSVLLINYSPDEIRHSDVRLDGEYGKLSAVLRSGVMRDYTQGITLNKDKVNIDYISAYGMVAFSVK